MALPEIPLDQPDASEGGQAEFARIYADISAQVAALNLEIVSAEQIDQAYVLRLAAVLGLVITPEEAHYFASQMRLQALWLNNQTTWESVDEVPLD